MAKYLLLFSFTGETVRRFVARPLDRAAVVRGLAESVGGGLESYYWMFGQYDGVGVVELPDSRAMAAVSLAAASSGAFTHLETHELIEAGDLAGIAERADQIAYQPPGASPAQGARVFWHRTLTTDQISHHNAGQPPSRRAPPGAVTYPP